MGSLDLEDFATFFLQIGMRDEVGRSVHVHYSILEATTRIKSTISRIFSPVVQLLGGQALKARH
jgi:hypothetical protein